MSVCSPRVGCVQGRWFLGPFLFLFDYDGFACVTMDRSHLKTNLYSGHRVATCFAIIGWVSLSSLIIFIFFHFSIEMKLNA